MARIYGNATPGRRPWVDVTLVSRTASHAVVRFAVGSDPVAGYTTSGPFSGTLKVNSASYAISGSVVSGATGTLKTFDVTYAQASAFTLSISLTGSVAGTTGWQSTSLSGTFNVAAGTSGSVPAAPTNLRLTNRNPESPQTFTLAWNAVSGATSYVIRASQNGGSWYDMTTATTTSKAVEYGDLNLQRRFMVLAVNAAGRGAASNLIGPVYGQPSMPGKPTLKTVTGGLQVTASGPGVYRTGRQIERRNPTGSWDVAGTATSWVDSPSPAPTAQYRVRDYAGDGDNRAYSQWSVWSESALSSVYKPPAITALAVARANASGTPTQMGTYLRVTWSGSVQSVKDGATELNKMTRLIRWRKTGTSAWTQSTVSNGAAPASWTNAYSTVGGGQIDVTSSYDVEVVAADVWETTIQAATVPTATVALSLSKTGAGVGKVWQQGALDVGGDVHVSGDLHLTGKLMGQDTGWESITSFATGWETYAARPAQLRRIGARVYMRGLVRNTKALPASTSTTAFTVPAGFLPPQFIATGATTTSAGDAIRYSSISENGEVKFNSATQIAANGLYSVDPLGWLTD
mgnify:CR=1 FL=1